MATKEDILEQLVEEYLLHEGYFVQHNLKFRPSRDHLEIDRRQDSNHSDVDVVGIHPRKTGNDRVVAISCKSWQKGFNPRSAIQALENEGGKLGGRDAWKHFRELKIPKWSEAFLKMMQDATGAKEFTYITAVTRLDGDKSVWEKHQPFSDAIGGNPIRVLDMREMLAAILPKLTTTVANTSIGRMLQLMKASGVTFKL